MSDGVSSADRQAIRRRHQVYQTRDARTGAPVQVCAGCGRDWPCDVPALLDALAAAEQRAAALEAALATIKRRANTGLDRAGDYAIARGYGSAYRMTKQALYDILGEIDAALA